MKIILYFIIGIILALLLDFLVKFNKNYEVTHNGRRLKVIGWIKMDEEELKFSCLILVTLWPAIVFMLTIATMIAVIICVVLLLGYGPYKAANWICDRTLNNRRPN